MNSPEILQDLQKSISRQKQLQAKAELVPVLYVPEKSSAGWICADGTSELDQARSQGDHLCNDPLTQRTERKIYFF